VPIKHVEHALPAVLTKLAYSTAMGAGAIFPAKTDSIVWITCSTTTYHAVSALGAMHDVVIKYEPVADVVVCECS